MKILSRLLLIFLFLGMIPFEACIFGCGDIKDIDLKSIDLKILDNNQIFNGQTIESERLNLQVEPTYFALLDKPSFFTNNLYALSCDEPLMKYRLKNITITSNQVFNGIPANVSLNEK
jgi:hypothetical protein